MTKICFSAEDGLYRAAAEGHAGDIEACNFVTGVFYLLAHFAMAEAAGHGAEISVMSLEPGHAEIELRGAGETAAAVFAAAESALRALSRTRPEAVQVEAKK